MTEQELAVALNKFMERYIKAPDDFETLNDASVGFVTDWANGMRPSYGKVCAAYLFQLAAEERC